MKNILRLTILLSTITYLNAQSNWQYLPNAPIGSWRIDDVFFLNNQTGWCAGSNGQIHKTIDGGAHWELVYNSNYYIRCLEFVDDSVGYAGTLNNKFLRSTDGGLTWVDLAASITPSPAAVCGISIVDSLYAYAVGAWDTPAILLKTTDGGNTWKNFSMNFYASALVDVFFTSRDTGFVTGQSGQGAVILYTTDGGETWEKKFSSGVPGQFVWKIQRVTNECWVGSIQTFNGGRMVKSTDAGQSWTTLTAPIPDMQGIGFATPHHGWVGGYVSGFYETMDGGESWEFKDFGGNFNRFYFLDSTLAYASGVSIYKFADSTLSSISQPDRPILKDDGFMVSISPNPTVSFLDIRFHLPVLDNLRIGIYTMDGGFIKEIYHERQLQAGEYQFQTDCSGLPAGAYFIGVQRNLGLYTRPFTKT